MDVKHLERGGRGAFVIRENGDRVAEMTYSVAGETGIIIDHTEVAEELRGQGVGEKLVEAAVKHARDKGLKIFATCPFAIKVLSSSNEYSDVYSG
jgi:predicted GNAT family acetyltransferase